MASVRVVREVGAGHSGPAAILAALLVGLGGGRLPIHVASVAQTAPEAILPTVVAIPPAITGALILVECVTLKMGARWLHAIWLSRDCTSYGLPLIMCS